MLSWDQLIWNSIFSPSAPTVKEGVREQSTIDNGGDVPESPMPNPCETGGTTNQSGGGSDAGDDDDSLSEIELLRRRLAEERHRRELAEQQVRSMIQSQPSTADANPTQRLARVDSLSHLHAMRDVGDQSPGPMTDKDNDAITSWTKPVDMPTSYTYNTKPKPKPKGGRGAARMSGGPSGRGRSGRGRKRVSPKRTHSDMSHSEGDSDAPSIASPASSANAPPGSRSSATTTPDLGGPVKKARRMSTPDQKKMIGQLFDDDDDDIVDRVLEDSAGSALSPPIGAAGGFAAHQSHRRKPPPRAPRAGGSDSSASPSAGSSSSARNSSREPSPIYPVLNSASSSSSKSARSSSSSSVYPVLKKPSARKIASSSQNNPEGSPLSADLGGSYEVIDSDDDARSSSRRPMSDIDDDDDDSPYEIEDAGDDDDGDDEWAVVPDTPASSAKTPKSSQRKSAAKSKSTPRGRVSFARKPPNSAPRTPAPRGTNKKLAARSSEDAADADESKHDFSDNEPENQRFVQKEFETPLRDPQASSATPEKPSNNHESESDDDVLFVGESPGPSRAGSIASIGGDSEFTTPGSASSGRGRRRRSRRTPKTPTRFVSRVPPPDTDGSDNESKSASSSSSRANDSAAKNNPESSSGSSGDFHSPNPKPSQPKSGANLDSSIVSDFDSPMPKPPQSKKHIDLNSSIISDFDVSLLSESDFEEQRNIERELQRARRASTVSSRPASPFTPSGAEVAVAQNAGGQQNADESFASENGNVSFMSEKEPTESDFDSAQYEDDDEDGDSDFQIEDAGAGKGANGDSDSNGEHKSPPLLPASAGASQGSPDKASSPAAAVDDEDFDEEMEDFDSIKLFIPAEISARYPSLKRVAKDRGICDFPLRCLRHTTHIIFEGDFDTKNSKERRWKDRVEKGDLIRKSPQWILGADVKPVVADNDNHVAAEEEKPNDNDKKSNSEKGSKSEIGAPETPAKSAVASPPPRPLLPETVKVGQKFTRRSFVPASWKARLAAEAKQGADAEAGAGAAAASSSSSSSSSRRPIRRRSRALKSSAVPKAGRSASGRRVRVVQQVDVSDTETDSESVSELEHQVDSDVEFDDPRRSLPPNAMKSAKKKPKPQAAPKSKAPAAAARKKRGRPGHVKRSSLEGLKLKTPNKSAASEISAPAVETSPSAVAPASGQSPSFDVAPRAPEAAAGSHQDEEEDDVLGPRSSSLERLPTKTPRKRVLQSKRETVFDDPNIDMNSSEIDVGIGAAGDSSNASEIKSNGNLPPSKSSSSSSSSSSSGSGGGYPPRSSSSSRMRSGSTSRSRSISNPQNPNISGSSSSSSSSAAAGSAAPPSLSRAGSLATSPGLERALSRLHSQATKPKPSAASSFVAEAEAAKDGKGKGTPGFLDKSAPRRTSVTKIVIAERRDRNRKKADKRVANSLKGLLSQMQK